MSFCSTSYHITMSFMFLHENFEYDVSDSYVVINIFKLTYGLEALIRDHRGDVEDKVHPADAWPALALLLAVPACGIACVTRLKVIQRHLTI